MVSLGKGFTVRVGEAESRWGHGEPHRSFCKEISMNYRLNIENESYSVEDIRIPSELTLAAEPIGQPFSFVSPVRLTIGQRCALRGDSGVYQLLVNACLGFTYTPRFLVAGIIAHKESAVANAS